MADDYDSETGEILPPDHHLAAPPASVPNNLIFASQDCAAVFGALSTAQGQMENPKKTKTATVNSKRTGTSYKYSYAPLDEVVNTIRKPLAEAKLIYRQFLASRGGQWVMRTVIAHESGQWFGCDYPIFADEGAQGFASGVTYARRYGLMLALGIVAEDDDDANVADGKPAQIASQGRAAQGNGAAPPDARQPQQATPAPADAAKAEARRRWTAMRDQIEAAATPNDLATIVTSPAWTEMTKHVTAADPEKAEGVIAKLSERAHEREALMRMPPQTEEYQ